LGTIDGGFYFAVEGQDIISGDHFIAKDEELYLLDIGAHELRQLLILRHFQMADELVEDHLVLDRLLTARNRHRIHHEFK
jgi:hypothetical protein